MWSILMRGNDFQNVELGIRFIGKETIEAKNHRVFYKISEFAWFHELPVTIFGAIVHFASIHFRGVGKARNTNNRQKNLEKIREEQLQVLAYINFFFFWFTIPRFIINYILGNFTKICDFRILPSPECHLIRDSIFHADKFGSNWVRQIFLETISCHWFPNPSIFHKVSVNPVYDRLMTNSKSGQQTTKKSV